MRVNDMYYVYAETVLLTNFSINIILLYITAKINKRKFYICRSLLAALIGAVYALLFIMRFYPATHLLAKPLITVAMTIVAFKGAKGKTYILLLGEFLLFSFALAGGVMALSGALKNSTDIGGLFAINVGGGSALFAYVITISAALILLIERARMKKAAPVAEVWLCCESCEVAVTVLLDNGNLLKSLTGKSIMILNATYISNILENVFALKAGVDAEEGMRCAVNTARLSLIQAGGVGGSELMLCFRADQVRVKQDDVLHDISDSVLIGVTNAVFKTGENGIAGILNPVVLTKGNVMTDEQIC